MSISKGVPGALSSNAPSHHYSAKQREMVKEQLERVLASPLFRNSKRFPEFLRYTVIQALSGETNCLKERMLGVSVFGRDANYDTSGDPVVRVTAAEVRKRITQYYEALGHEHELRIEFERGSYVPEFRFTYEGDSQHAHRAPASAEPQWARKLWTRHWLPITCASAACLITSALLLGSTRQTALDRFWAPVVATGNPALLCVPDPSLRPDTPTTTVVTANGAAISPHVVSLGDSLALSLVSEVLGRKGKDFHVRTTDDVTLEDLREGPVVLIGAFSNRWTMRLVTGLRFSFGRDDSTGYIADVRNPSSRQWSVPSQTTPGSDMVDYGLITRVVNATTGRSLVTVAGIRSFGTEAAAECLDELACLESAAKLAPGDWKKDNLQIVLKTNVIGTSSGQPQVLAAYVW